MVAALRRYLMCVLLVTMRTRIIRAILSRNMALFGLSDNLLQEVRALPKVERVVVHRWFSIEGSDVIFCDIDCVEASFFEGLFYSLPVGWSYVHHFLLDKPFSICCGFVHWCQMGFEVAWGVVPRCCLVLVGVCCVVIFGEFNNDVAFEGSCSVAKDVSGVSSTDVGVLRVFAGEARDAFDTVC